MSKPTNKPRFNPWLLWGGFILLFVIINYTSSGGLGNSKELPISKFNEILEKGQVERVVFNRSSAKVFLTEEAKKQDEQSKAPNNVFAQFQEPSHFVVDIANVELFEKNLMEARQNNLIKEYKSEKESDWTGILIGFLPFVLLIVFYLWMMRRMTGGAGGGAGGGQIFSIGKSRAKLFDEKNDVRVTFSDVAGLEGAKEEIQEIVEFLKNPEKYTSIGGKIPKGALLVGPPGTGKTLLAKAVAGEAKVPFFSLSGSDFVEMFVGVGASRVRDLFKQAKEKSPAIIFIDEIDAIGRARGKSNFSGSNDERENTLNQLLTEMDGFGTNTNVIVLAATNRAEILDKALMRAGRFDRQIYVDLPDVRERKQIFEVHLRNIK